MALPRLIMGKSIEGKNIPPKICIYRFNPPQFFNLIYKLFIWKQTIFDSAGIETNISSLCSVCLPQKLLQLKFWMRNSRFTFNIRIETTFSEHYKRIQQILISYQIHICVTFNTHYINVCIFYFVYINRCRYG